MFDVLKSSWALLIGVMLLMVGNGIQGTLLGLRGAIEGFSTYEMSLVMSGYFAGFLGGSRATPGLIRRVGHVRVFAALGSFISAALILFPVITDPIAWTLLRVAIGFSFSGVYVTAESWLNHAATNQNRGKALSLYLIVQMIGIIAAQGLVVLADPGGFILFILPSVLVSLAFAPILLSVSPTPAFATARRMTLRDLVKISPLGVVGIMLIGGVFSALFGMAAVFATQAGLSIGRLSIFIAMIYVGGLVMQYPIGWISDRVDRRGLILTVAALGALAALVPVILPGNYPVLILAAFLIGGTANPLYALLLAYTNDFLEVEDMPAASAGLMFVNGVGAVAGPLVTGWAMTTFGPQGFFVYLAVMLLALVGYGLWRTTRRASPSVEETQSYAPVLPSASPVAMDMAQEIYAEAVEEAAEDGTSDTNWRSDAQ
ncbi:MFS transporter [Maritimibacter sp. HL-12]|uniref:MFS transporter n=1 Tax=Maritimibacter sp. HL-12 TaxID=1162418 RepID=UPI000A0F2CE3|nr:MFS transporter [Maritimibacter sp. HL-12]SMH56062.1 Predicted arabinose efflux permease, MFS family [Maritimibacter sp. HL-12]